jgi:lipoprotein-anchoring transpeptidase ErfK/SrfK
MSTLLSSSRNSTRHADTRFDRARLRAPRGVARGWLKALAGVVVAIAATGLAAAPSAGAREVTAVAPTQELATLLESHEAFSQPDAGASRAGIVRGRRPITGEQTVLPVVGRATTTDGTQWLRVLIPGRPNGKKGWIRQLGTVLKTTSWHLLVITSSRRVLVYRRGRRVRSFAAIVGKPSTPTPHGQFFVEEGVRLSSGSPGAPFALALSARSNVLQEFEGGPGQVALHGVANLGGTLGTAVSHGCVRLATRSIRWLAARIGPGVPVTIR